MIHENIPFERLSLSFTIIIPISTIKILRAAIPLYAIEMFVTMHRGGSRDSRCSLCN